MESFIWQTLIFRNELPVNFFIRDYTFQYAQATKSPLCFSVSPLYPPGLQGVVSVQVASLSLHKTGDLAKKRSCNKSQPKPLTLTEITAWLVFTTKRWCVQDIPHNETGEPGCSLLVSLKAHATRRKRVCEKNRHKRWMTVSFFQFTRKKRPCQHMLLYAYPLSPAIASSCSSYGMFIIRREVCVCERQGQIVIKIFFLPFLWEIRKEGGKKKLRMRVRAFTGNWKSTDPLYFAYRQSPANLSNKDIRLSDEWGPNEKDTNTEYHSTEIETDGDRHENRRRDKCAGLVTEWLEMEP